MNIDVFISHSSKDANIANAICNTLEANNIKCWIAPRDIRPGSDWAESINNAIENSKAMVLVFSENSNNSTQVAKELNLAINNKLIVLPFKIDDSNPTGSMKYYLSDTHWLDAVNGDVSKNIDLLKNLIRDTVSHPYINSQKPKNKILKWYYIIPLIIVLSLVCFFTIKNIFSNKEKRQVYETYKYTLNTFYNNYDYDVRYTLFDIDNNGIPELIYNIADWQYHVYSFNNNLVYSGEIDAKYGIMKYGDMLLAHNGGTGYSEYGQVQLNKALKIQQDVIPYLSRESHAPISDSSTYLLNRKEISESEYMKIYNSMYDLKMIPKNDLSLLEILK